MTTKKIYRKFLGTKNMPRLSLFRSNKHLYAQLIDDINGYTLFSISTVREYNNIKIKNNNNSFVLGEQVKKFILLKNFNKIFLDIKHYSYKGRIKEFCKGLNS